MPYPSIYWFEYLATNKYKLTDSVSDQTAAMWNKTKIDLTQDFVISMTMNFGKRHDTLGQRGGSDGIAFVLHNIQDTNVIKEAIGAGKEKLGYMHETFENNYNFAIEFDTEWSSAAMEGGETVANHISYTKANANVSGTYKQLQDNWRTVEDGKEYCVTIVWKRTNTNDITEGFDLIAYVKELGDYSQHSGRMLLRDTFPILQL